MGTTVTHRNENVVLLEPDGRLVYSFASDVHLGFGIIVIFKISDENYVWIIILYDIRHLVVLKVDNCSEGG